MKTMTVTEVSRNFSSVMDGMVADQEEIVLVRNNKPVARLVPEPPELTALEVLGDLYRTLDNETAGALANAMKQAKRAGKGALKELRNPWVS